MIMGLNLVWNDSVVVLTDKSVTCDKSPEGSTRQTAAGYYHMSDEQHSFHYSSALEYRHADEHDDIETGI